MIDCPYKGLMPYTEEDEAFFFGREDEREIITANLMASRLTLLYGPSGVGKSSVLRAGVVHHLHQAALQNLTERGTPGFAIVVFSAWRDDPIVGLTKRVQSAVTKALNGRLVEPPPQSCSFEKSLATWAEYVGGELLIILDQFEEFFLYHAQEDGEGTFAFEFPRAARCNDVRASFLISIREDALANLDLFKGRLSNLFDNYLRIEHLDREAARRAIERPLERYNALLPEDAQRVSIEPGLVDAVLDQVRTGKVSLGETGRGLAEEVSGRGGIERRIETPYLQLVMTRLWKEERGDNQDGQMRSPVLRLKTLNDLGGAERITHSHLDGIMAALSPTEQDTAAQVFQYLVTRSRTKIAYPALALAGEAGLEEIEIASVLEKLSRGDARILRQVGPAPGEPAEPQHERYEIFHDVLCPAVLDWRMRFVQEQERLEAARKAEEQQAIKRAETKRRVQRRLQMVAIGTLIVTVILLVFLASTEWRAATWLWQRFEQEHALATVRKLATQAESRFTPLNVGLLLSVEATRLSGEMHLADLPEAKGSLLDGLQRSSPRCEIPGFAFRLCFERGVESEWADVGGKRGQNDHPVGCADRQAAGQAP